MSGTAPAPRGLIGFLDALRDGQMVVGWAADPRDRAARPIIRLMRGLEVLAECVADVARDDGNPGFRLRAPEPLAPQDFLEGRVRVRALLEGHHAATTLAMTRRMREELEAAAGWEPTTQATPAPEPEAKSEPEPEAQPEPEPEAKSEPEPESPPEPASRPQPAPERQPQPAPPREPAPAWSTPGWVSRPPEPGERPEPVPRPPAATPPPAVPPPAVPPPVIEVPAAEVPQPATPPDLGPDPEPPLPAPLAAMHALARLAAAARCPALHMLVPTRGSVLGRAPLPGMAALEALAAARPLLARDWVPLRHAFARQPQPGALWRLDGRSLTVEGSVALLSTLLAVLQLRYPQATDDLVRAAGLLTRVELAALPRRDMPPDASAPGREAFLGVSVAETEPAVPLGIFADLPAPRLLGQAMPGLEAWSAAAAPLPWRVVVLAEPGLGGSASPAQIGWWLRWMVAECVISEALHIAPPEAALGPQPDLVLTLAAEPDDREA